MTEQQRLIGYMVMWVLDLYLEGKVPLPPADVIAARMVYLCGQYNILKRAMVALGYNMNRS